MAEDCLTVERGRTPSSVIDWGKCALCQVDNTERLCDPLKTKSAGGAIASYTNIQNSIERFHDMSQLSSLPFIVPYESLKAEGTISNTLKKNYAVWHKTCCLEIGVERLKRVMKRELNSTVESTSEAASGGANFSSCSEGPSSSMKIRRKSVDFSNECCVICTNSKRTKRLKSVATIEVGKKLKQCAVELEDVNLMERLGANDAQLVGVKYHLECFSAITRKCKSTTASQKQPSSEYESSDNVQVRHYVMAGIISYIESIKAQDNSTIFKLDELEKMYTGRMKEFGYFTDFNSSRFKENLLRACPKLEAYTVSRKKGTFIIFKDDIPLLVQNSFHRNYQEEGQQMSTVVKFIRDDIFREPLCDWNNESSKTISSIPNSLKTLVRTLLHGQTTQNDDGEEFDQVVSTISELIQFNIMKYSPKGQSEKHRHRQSREMPIPVHLALKIYNETRNKKLIKFTSKLGITISYNRLQEIITDQANEVSDQYRFDKVIAPRSFNKGLFVTAAADNVDQNLSSVTAVGSFHGTAISFVQHLTEDEKGIPREYPKYERRKTVSPLPEEYAVVQPFNLNSKAAKCPSTKTCTTQVMDASSPLTQELSWLEGVINDHHTSWASFHAQNDTNNKKIICANIALLPVLPESAHSIDTMFHCMKTVSSSTAFLNPGQTPVMTVDQPLYALCKQIQWIKPEMFGEKKFFVMFGGLHIELTTLRVIGKWLDGSGWTEVLVDSNLTTSGRADSIIKASHISRSRYAHEVTSAVLFTLLKEAYHLSHNEESDGDNYDSWCKNNMKRPQFKYWYTVMELELTLMQFVRSIRTADFLLYIDTLVRLIPWFFVLDHTNYARWLSVHVRDLVNVGENVPDVANRFKAGHFIVRKTANKFSGMALDQCHEQLNAELKGSGGFIGLTEKPDSLRKYMMGSPEIVSMVKRFEQKLFTTTNIEDDCDHHSDSAFYKNRFARHFEALLSTMKSKGNPFLEESSDLFNISSKKVASEAVMSTVFTAEILGQSQYNDFVKERLESSSKAIMDPIKTNKVILFKSSIIKTKDKVKAKMAELKGDRQLFSKLYIACQTRDGDLDEFFSHENQYCPPALCDELGEMRVCTKSDLIRCLTGVANDTVTDKIPYDVNVKIIDGAALVNMLAPNATLKTFRDYAENLFGVFIRRECTPEVKRIEIVWDRYFSNSLKQHARDKRGLGTRVKVNLETKLPKGWPNFLRESSNKEALFALLAQWLVQQPWGHVQLITTCGANVLCSNTYNTSFLSPCNHEEADTRIFVHLADAVRQGFGKVLIRTVDTDIVVIAISVFNALPSLQELWVHFGSGKHQQFIAIHSIVRALGNQKASVLPIFHALTGCDTVSAMFGRGKKTAFEAWSNCPGLTEVLTTIATECYENVRGKLEQFFIKMYDRSSQATEVNVCRKELFIKKNREIFNIPPTSDALKQHVLRAIYQGCFIWGNALQVHQTLPDPSLWGWALSENGWTPIWMEKPPAQEACMELIKCGCKIKCTEQYRCRCRKNCIPCTPLCNCDGLCA